MHVAIARGASLEVIVFSLSFSNLEQIYNELLTAGANVNVQSEEGYAAIHFAAITGNITGLEFLLDHKAFLKDTKLGQNVLHLAAEYQQESVFEVLNQRLVPIHTVVSHRTQEEPILLNLKRSRDHMGRLPAHIAAHFGNKNCLLHACKDILPYPTTPTTSERDLSPTKAHKGDQPIDPAQETEKLLHDFAGITPLGWALLAGKGNTSLSSQPFFNLAFTQLTIFSEQCVEELINNYDHTLPPPSIPSSSGNLSSMRLYFAPVQHFQYYAR